MNENVKESIGLGAAVTGVEEKTGETAADAVPQTSGEKIAPAAGEQKKSATRAERFNALIEGEFRDEYNARVQSIVKQRLKGSEETTRKYKALAPALALLEKRYGVEHGDAQALRNAIESDRTGARAEAGESRRKERASRLCGEWIEQGRELCSIRPGTNLAQELQNPRFRELLINGASVKDAYEIANHDELMRQEAEEMERRLTRKILAGADRPREGGLSAQSSAVVKNDAASMSREARREIIRRVQRGEKIIL